jgi:hypothetical protein
VPKQHRQAANGPRPQLPNLERAPAGIRRGFASVRPRGEEPLREIVVVLASMQPETTAALTRSSAWTSIQPRVPARRDVSGLATPRPRTHFAALVVRMCIATIDLPTIAPQSFHLALANGAEAPLKFPQTVFADDLDLLGEPGCERGHIVFQVPRSERPSALRFDLDWGRTDMQGFTDSTKLRFEWTLQALLQSPTRNSVPVHTVGEMPRYRVRGEPVVRCATEAIARRPFFLKAPA